MTQTKRKRSFARILLRILLALLCLVALAALVMWIIPITERDSSEIVAHALAGNCDVSRETLELFCAFLGSAAGNIALTLGARGGVFIAGGIAPRFVDFLRRSAFRERFEAKGRMSTYLAQIPTAVIVHATPAFIGLAHLAKVRSRPSARDHAW